MIKKLFNLKGGRFIDIYGRPWHKNNVFDRVKPFYYINTGVHLAVLFGAAASAPELLPQLGIIVGKSYLGACAGHVAMEHLLYDTLTKPIKATKYAIDREGRSFPPHNNLDLEADVQNIALNSTILLGVLGASSLMSEPNADMLTQQLEKLGVLKNLTENSQKAPLLYAFAGRASACTMMLTIFGNWLRSQKLLKGKYVFCGTPPAAPNTQKVPKIAKVFGIAPK